MKEDQSSDKNAGLSIIGMMTGETVNNNTGGKQTIEAILGTGTNVINMEIMETIVMNQVIGIETNVITTRTTETTGMKSMRETDTTKITMRTSVTLEEDRE